jgi:hypothetical protein
VAGPTSSPAYRSASPSAGPNTALASAGAGGASGTRDVRGDRTDSAPRKNNHPTVRFLAL